MTIEKFKECVGACDTLGAILTIPIIHPLNKTHKDLGGETPLIYAADAGLVSVVCALLDAGADVDVRDEHGWTALNTTSSFDVTEVLIKYGARVDLESPEGWTPLHHAAVEGDTGRVELLVKSGSNVETKKDDGWTALHLAAYNNRLEIAKLLVEAGANTLVLTNDNETPYDLAMQCGHQNMADLLNASSITKGNP